MRSFAKSLTLLSALFILFACGGGGSVEREGGDGTPTTPTPPSDPEFSISLSIADQNGNETNTLNSETPLNIMAVVTNSDGDAVSDELVTFTLAPEGLAEFTNDSGTALTDINGEAMIGLVAGQQSGSGKVVATLEDGTTAQIGYTSEGQTVVQDQPASLNLFADISQLPSSGSDEVELWAVVKDAQNILLPGVSVNFSADGNASIQNTQPVTDENGMARVLLKTGGDFENRTITARASIADYPELTQELTIQVVGTAVTINGANSVIVNDSSTLTVALVDSDGEGISGETVALTAENSSGTDVTADVLSQSAVRTNAEGRATVTFASGASGDFTVTASALGTSTEFDVTVQQDEFSFVNAPDVNDVNDDIPLGESQVLTLAWLKDGSPYEGGTVTLTTSRGTITPTSAQTNANGRISVSVQSDNAGEATIVATGVDADGAEVSTRLDIAFIATESATIIVDATPDAIGPDGQTSTISAVVRDPNGNRVRNKLVNFSVTDVSNGALTDAQARTDKRGIATTVYQSNAVSSTEQVTVRATVSDNMSVFGEATLTVGDRPFDIIIGTGKLVEVPTQSSYTKEFSAFVTDPDGNPVPDTAITFSVTPLKVTEGDTYAKGTWEWTGTVWSQVISVSCTNEDENFNGMLDFSPVNEDRNGDNELTPGNVAVIDEEVVTDENGQALVYLRYPIEYGAWATVKITARGESAGTESRSAVRYTLGVLAEDLKDEAISPPNSPFGQSDSCANTL